MMCLEQEKPFPHLGKNTIPSLTPPGWYFATSGLISVVLRLKYVCSCVVEIHYLYNTFAFKVLRATSLFLQCLPPHGARGREEVWSTCLLQRRVKANPEGRQKGPLSVLFFSASSSHVLKEIVLLVISDDYIHKIRPWNSIPVLETDHLQSESYFVPLFWLPLLPWALGRSKKPHHSDCFSFPRCLLRESVFWALLQPLKQNLVFLGIMWDQVIAWSKGGYWSCNSKDLDIKGHLLLLSISSALNLPGYKFILSSYGMAGRSSAGELSGFSGISSHLYASQKFPPA